MWKCQSTNVTKEHLILTATAAIGLVILSIASKPSLERRSFVWPGSGSTIGNLQVIKTSFSPFLTKEINNSKDRCYRFEHHGQPMNEILYSMWYIQSFIIKKHITE